MFSNKRFWYSIELANAYDKAARELVGNIPIDMEPSDEVLRVFERLDSLAEIWNQISYKINHK